MSIYIYIYIYIYIPTYIHIHIYQHDLPAGYTLSVMHTMTTLNALGQFSGFRYSFFIANLSLDNPLSKLKL